MSCQAVTYRDTGLAGLTGKLSKRDTCRRWEVALFCFSSFLLSARSCLPNYREFQAGRPGWHSDTSTAENPAQKAHKGGRGSSNVYEMNLDCHRCTGRSGCRAQREGRVWPSPAHPTVPSHITFVPSLYRPVLSLLLCLQVRQHRACACRKPGLLWSKCFLSSSGPHLSALILHHC